MRTLYASFHAQNTLHYTLASIPIKTTTTTTKKSYPSLSIFTFIHSLPMWMKRHLLGPRDVQPKEGWEWNVDPKDKEIDRPPNRRSSKPVPCRRAPLVTQRQVSSSSFFFFLAHWSINYSTHPPYFQFQGKPPRVTLYFLYNKDAKGLIQLGIICHFMKYEYISILIKGNVNFFLVYCNCGDLGLRLKINTILSRIMARYNVRS